MKVFGTGLQRTGTESLAKALDLLGIQSIRFPHALFRDRDSSCLQQFDGFVDFPIPLIYKELYQRYPQSKFVHTIRDERAWLESTKWLFSVGAIKFNWKKNGLIDEFHRHFYGRTTFDPTVFLQRYREHNQDVVRFFSTDPDHLLVLDLSKQDAFAEICRFLDCRKPDVPFPHDNRRETLLKVLARKAATRLKRRQE